MGVLDPAGWPVWLAVAVVVLAVHRITRLLVADRILAGARARVAYADPGQPKTYRPRAGYLTTCPWCVSVWVAAAVVPAVAVCWPWSGWPVLVLAASSATGLLGMGE